MYVDKVIVSKLNFPSIPYKAMNSVNKTAKDVFKWFMEIFIAENSLKDVCDIIHLTVSEITLSETALCHDTTRTDMCEIAQILLQNYIEFHTTYANELNFLRNPPPGIVIGSIECRDLDEATVLLQLHYTVMNGEENILHGPGNIEMDKVLGIRNERNQNKIYHNTNRFTV